MAARNKVLFEDVAGELTAGQSETSDSVSARKRTIGYLQERENRLAQLANGEIIEKMLLWVVVKCLCLHMLPPPQLSWQRKISFPPCMLYRKKTLLLRYRHHRLTLTLPPVLHHPL